MDHDISDYDETDELLLSGYPQKKKSNKFKIIFGVITGLVFLFTALILVTLFILIPVLAQSFLDKSTLTFLDVSITEPQNKSFLLHGVGFIDKKLPIPAYIVDTVLSFNYLNETVGNISIHNSKLQSVSGGSTLEITTNFEILNYTLFSEFSRDMIREELLIWNLKGLAYIKILGMKYKLKMDKDIKINGLNSFPNITMKSYDMTRSNATHIFLDITVDINNPSVISLSPVGNLRMDIYYKDSLVGEASFHNVSFFKGSNIIDMKGMCLPENNDKLGELISLFIGGKHISVVTKPPKDGNLSDIPLFNDALQNLILNMSLTPKPTELIKSLSIDSISLEPLSEDSVDSNITITAQLFNPLGNNSDIWIYDISMNSSLLYKKHPIGRISFPELIVNESIYKPIKLNLSTTMFIQDHDYLIEFIDDFVNFDILDIGFSGNFTANAKISFGNITIIEVPVSSMTKMIGLGGLKDARINEMDMPYDHEDGGIAVIANATFTNPSPMSISLGGVVVDLVSGKVVLGHAQCDQLTIKPGLNELSMSGQIIEAEDLDVTNKLVSNYIKGIPQYMSARGSRSVNGTIKWVDKAIKKIILNALVPGLKDFKGVHEVEVETMNLDFSQKRYPIATGVMRGYYKSPFGFSFTFLNCSMTANILYNDIVIAEYEIINHEIKQYHDKGYFTIGVNELYVTITNKSIFSDFLAELFLKEESRCVIKGVSTSMVSTKVGNLTIIELPFENEVVLNGTNGFNDPPIKVDNLKLLGGSGDRALIGLDLYIFNPSSAELSAGTVNMSMLYKDTILGYGSIPSLQLNYDWNMYDVLGIYQQTEENKLFGREFLSLFLQGKETNVTFRGHTNSTDIDVLKKAMSLLVVNATIPGMNVKLISYAHLILSLDDILGKLKMPAELTINNPYSIYIYITKVNVTMNFKNKTIGQLDQSFEDDPIVVNPNGSTITPIVYANILDFDADLIKAITGIIYVDVEGTLTARIEDFEQELDYIQIGIPTSFLPQNETNPFQIP